MSWLTDEMIYYGGMILAAIAIIVFLIYMCASIAASGKLKMKLREEYGENRSIKKH